MHTARTQPHRGEGALSSIVVKGYGLRSLNTKVKPERTRKLPTPPHRHRLGGPGWPRALLRPGVREKGAGDNGIFFSLG
eukprot:scaffold90764_cov32-Tisochrysis_lutea.AAC.3